MRRARHRPREVLVDESGRYYARTQVSPPSHTSGSRIHGSRGPSTAAGAGISAQLVCIVVAIMCFSRRFTAIRRLTEPSAEIKTWPLPPPADQRARHSARRAVPLGHIPGAHGRILHRPSHAPQHRYGVDFPDQRHECNVVHELLEQGSLGADALAIVDRHAEAVDDAIRLGVRVTTAILANPAVRGARDRAR